MDRRLDLLRRCGAGLAQILAEHLDRHLRLTRRSKRVRDADAPAAAPPRLGHAGELVLLASSRGSPRSPPRGVRDGLRDRSETMISEKFTPSACSSPSARPVRRPRRRHAVDVHHERRRAGFPNSSDVSRLAARRQHEVDLRRPLVERRQELRAARVRGSTMPPSTSAISTRRDRQRKGQAETDQPAPPPPLTFLRNQPVRTPAVTAFEARKQIEAQHRGERQRHQQRREDADDVRRSRSG